MIEEVEVHLALGVLAGRVQRRQERRLVIQQHRHREIPRLDPMQAAGDHLRVLQVALRIEHQRAGTGEDPAEVLEHLEGVEQLVLEGHVLAAAQLGQDLGRDADRGGAGLVVLGTLAEEFAVGVCVLQVRRIERAPAFLFNRRLGAACRIGRVRALRAGRKRGAVLQVHALGIHPIDLLQRFVVADARLVDGGHHDQSRREKYLVGCSGRGSRHRLPVRQRVVGALHAFQTVGEAPGRRRRRVGRAHPARHEHQREEQQPAPPHSPLSRASQAGKVPASGLPGPTFRRKL
jgi:hypothetical protein